jgi:hypothetical protein
MLDVRKAPSAFGEISVRVQSHLRRGEVIVTTQAPPRPVAKWLLRLPDPPGYRIAKVRIGPAEAPRDADGRVDLTGRSGPVVVRFEVERR